MDIPEVFHPHMLVDPASHHMGSNWSKILWWFYEASNNQQMTPNVWTKHFQWKPFVENLENATKNPKTPRVWYTNELHVHVYVVASIVKQTNTHTQRLPYPLLMHWRLNMHSIAISKLLLCNGSLCNCLSIDRLSSTYAGLFHLRSFIT